MRSENIYNKINSRKGQIAILIDPDKFESEKKTIDLIKKISFAKIDYIFIGGSTVLKSDFDKVIHLISKNTNIPIVIFPGSNQQISEKADAILYLSLLSGRNPDFLIGHHVQSAQEIYNMDLEVIPTGYILIDGGTKSSVAYVSQTTPIPRDQTSIAISTAIAGKLQGKKIIYFDAGSGAKEIVPFQLINEVSKLNIPVIVGGGIKSIEEIELYFKNGANIVVIGNFIEENIEFLLDLKAYISN